MKQGFIILYNIKLDTFLTSFCSHCRAADRFCGAIISGNGTFADCLSHVDLQQFATDCTFDMCATNGDLETFSKVSPKMEMES